MAVAREVEEELGLDIEAGRLLLTDWLPPWCGWDDAVCLVFDGGVHDPSRRGAIVPQAREIQSARFCTLAEVRELLRRLHRPADRLRPGRPASRATPAYTRVRRRG